MVTQPPPFPDVGSITKGVGKLSPEVWDSLIWASKWLHENAADLDKILKGESSKKEVRRKWFFAKLKKAKLVADNQYIYSWEKINLGTGSYSFSVDSNVTSTGETDEWDYAAMNIIEGYNTGDNTSTGTDEGAASFPATMTLQAIGGGSLTVVGATTTLNITAPVMMFVNRDTDYAARYIFSAANSYDGGCPE